jgi:hypothetical protein
MRTLIGFVTRPHKWALASDAVLAAAPHRIRKEEAHRKWVLGFCQLGSAASQTKELSGAVGAGDHTPKINQGAIPLLFFETLPVYFGGSILICTIADFETSN